MAISGQLHTYLQIPAAQQGPGSELGWTSPDGGDLKVSDDGHLAMPDAGEGASRLAWATAEDIARANATLQGQGSTIRLKAGAVGLRGKAPDGDPAGSEIALSRVNLTEADGSKPVTLAGDCGKAAYEIMGASDDGNLGAAVVQTPAGEVTTDPHPYAGRKREQTDLVGTTELWLYEILRMAWGDLPNAELIARYQAQSPEERAAFEVQWGLNQHAVPKVGEAVSTMSLWAAPGWASLAGDKEGWNWHFAAAVLASGGDYITLENYTGAPAGNWYFAMYGPARYNQSFHQQEFATNAFGTEAVSMVVRPESRVRLTLDLAENPDTLASAELYVRLSTSAGTRTSESVSVAPGEPGSVLISLADLLVTGESRPLQLDVFDEDLWSDEHLATVTWLPPFGPTRTVENGVTIAGEMIR